MTALRPPVTLVAHDIGPVGGMERQLTRLVTGLSALGHEVTVVARRCHIADEPGVRWIRVPGPTRPFPIAALWFFVAGSLAVRARAKGLVHATGAIVLNRADVITVHFCHHEAALQSGAARRRKASFIYTVNAALSSRIARFAERVCYTPRRVRRMVGVAEAVREEVERHFPELRSRTEVIPNGVDDGFFRVTVEARACSRSQLEVPANDLVALFVGGDWEHKGLRRAIEALPMAPRWRLVVVGDGDQRTYRTLTASLGVESRTRFVGVAEDPRSYYAAADAFVLPSAYETFSLVTLEAAAARLPLVVTYRGGVAKDILQDGVNGHIVARDGKAIAKALNDLEDEDVRLEMGRRSRAAAAAFRWDDVVRRYSELYRRLWDEGAGNR